MDKNICPRFVCSGGSCVGSFDRLMIVLGEFVERTASYPFVSACYESSTKSEMIHLISLKKLNIDQSLK